ncbi:Hypothetical protein PP7435_CHR3-0150 [Komagataella phaffii CBS 7435]|uniref:Uncharacterized protein n=2 Tax=Komagataella phaffii TaxID=460519 RepID=C4R695_KOMPG|nr:uncharacterized protein PAS_chr3_1246 [Komagataella phaffii GS115]AOA64055.1 GQ67_04149T0 [Komagataella phaffii]CAH2449080.1 Hypothetical protein BQ9382_C3-0865 [Komagataella phaffii CBS 7435]AOA68944.1 GQ68_04122T0 [Komagataella phaffii GS115]CAY71081.1 hypothetical protein PAS_chr3_1246 [Komagataella phaffii GS115]CCA39122.1 Hypothetical protein PP7435_CHR3-0150 [Komagataella phaffii CBS 7435]
MGNDGLSKTTLARLFHTVAFEEPDTRISSKTLELSIEYLKIFTKEAVIRADEVRRDRNGQVRSKYNIKLENVEDQPIENTDSNGGILDVNHLSQISGSLILDF